MDSTKRKFCRIFEVSCICECEQRVDNRRPAFTIALIKTYVASMNCARTTCDDAERALQRIAKNENERLWRVPSNLGRESITLGRVTHRSALKIANAREGAKAPIAQDSPQNASSAARSAAWGSR